MASVLALALIGCAAHARTNQTAFVPFTHVSANAAKGDAEHDAMFYRDGEADYYPNQRDPRRILMRPNTGGTLDILCLNETCNEFLVRTKGLKDTPDGSLDLTQIDPKIALVRDGDTEEFVGYLVANDKGQYVVAHTLDEARADETPHSALKTAGKIALMTMMIAALVVGAAAMGAAGSSGESFEPSPPPTFTHCTAVGPSVDCISQ
jgi:hypothetical protein